MQKLTKEGFIDRAKMLYPNYNYDKVVYLNNKNKVTIICPEHGEFQIRPDCMLNHTGCPTCGGTKKMNTDIFIEKANYVHNNFFTYGKCVYNGSNEKVVVTCPYHGDFQVKANNHLMGQNCGECRKEHITHETRNLQQVNSSTKKLTTPEFIEKAKKVHGNRYTYEKVNYIKSCKKITVTCVEHGDFEITPNHLLGGRGCPKCAKNYRMTNNEFISRMIEINGDKYTYENTKYVSTHKNVLITCKIHGDFFNSPANLLKGQGCPLCTESKLENEIRVLLENNNINYIREKTFPWLGKQKLDFYLPEYNAAIECQGIQHFKPIDFFGGEAEFKLTIERDERKKTLCEKNNIVLLYFNSLKDNIDKKYFTDKIKLLTEINNGKR